jgi:hypothetical protein
MGFASALVVLATSRSHKLHLPWPKKYRTDPLIEEAINGDPNLSAVDRKGRTKNIFMQTTRRRDDLHQRRP